MPKGAGLDIDYRVATAEELAASGATFDAVLLLEVVEHVPDVPAFLKGVAPLVKPGGVMILSTLNRTYKAYALRDHRRRADPALAAGRHPSMAALRHARGASRGASSGRPRPRPTRRAWSTTRSPTSGGLSRDTDVNYFATATRHGVINRRAWPRPPGGLRASIS